MRTHAIKISTTCILALFGAAAAQADIVGVTAAGGSDGLLSLVNTADGSSITQDLGEQIAQIAIGDQYSLTSAVADFITSAGGLANIQFAVTAGSATNGTSAATYLTSSKNLTTPNVANGVRGTWYSNFSNLVTKLNTIDATPGNISYGPFASGVNGNYVSGGHDDWGTAGTCVANSTICNLGLATADLFLYTVNFGTAPTGFASYSKLDAANGGAKAVFDVANSTLNIVSASTVPAPAAGWLLLTGLGGLLVKARRRVASSA